MYNLIFKKDAEKYYQKSSKDTKKRLNRIFYDLSNGDFNQLDIKPLKGKLTGIYRIRIGYLRIFYEFIDEKNISVLAILPRGDAY